MKIDIHSPKELGALLRATRKAMRIRQDDAAGLVGVSENFLGKVERGGETVQWGKLFHVMRELGLSITIEVPESFANDIQQLLVTAQNKKIAKRIKSPHCHRDPTTKQGD
ncbi:helix-turn-helix domain-containing protein [Pseudomonas aeruginosa]|uniref:helix-turn-helix domain-containing protein n=1 Tax=Pseudomonas aeruginosa TaxID=287 RepID=UPI002ADD49D5|nr:helix-turn-helix domain-containing protein [Pseudomonas aeruginosa]MEA0988996.1 helix-turn-helix domain-containing protein [Pseudomonas aeruginosa]HCF3047441.1 helix-turn-helix transcriptional regulator [Pseudomonas aeruginosa]HCL3290480.1 helix-turn-helix transcriptional regulator [Pseudomonas aeruginosa]